MIDGKRYDIDFNKIRAVIFDVDGTLYDLSAVRREMALEIFLYYILRPLKWRDIKILLDFRRACRIHINDISDDLDNAQYTWAAGLSGAKPQQARELVKKWMFEKPLKHLAAHRYPFLMDFLKALSTKGIKAAFCSDFSPHDKLIALGIEFTHAFCSTEKGINRFKPDPKLFLAAADVMKVRPQECLVIGDTDELDGEAARRGGFPYIVLKKNFAGTFYSDLTFLLANSPSSAK